MIEPALLFIALFSMLLLVWNIFRSNRRGARKSLGIFSYAELLEQPEDAAKPKKAPPHA